MAVCIRPGSGHAELKRRELHCRLSWTEAYQLIVGEGKLELGPLQKAEIEDPRMGSMMEVMEDEKTVHDAFISDA